MIRLNAPAAIVVAAIGLGGCATGPAPGTDPLSRVQSIVVIYAENRSFDHLYGLFPGAEGIANATAAQTTQLDFDDKPLPHLPAVWTSDGKPDIKVQVNIDAQQRPSDRYEVVLKLKIESKLAETPSAIPNTPSVVIHICDVTRESVAPLCAISPGR